MQTQVSLAVKVTPSVPLPVDHKLPEKVGHASLISVQHIPGRWPGTSKALINNFEQLKGIETLLCDPMALALPLHRPGLL